MGSRAAQEEEELRVREGGHNMDEVWRVQYVVKYIHFNLFRVFGVLIKSC